MDRRLFALDQNFPVPIIEVAQMHSSGRFELVPIALANGDWATLDDWELFVALYRDERPWDGLITSDGNILKLPREMSVLRQTRLKLVVAEGKGHNPVPATGLVLTHIDHICGQIARAKSQVWELRATSKRPTAPDDFLARIARRLGVPRKELEDRYHVDVG